MQFKRYFSGRFSACKHGFSFQNAGSFRKDDLNMAFRLDGTCNIPGVDTVDDIADVFAIADGDVLVHIDSGQLGVPVRDPFQACDGILHSLGKGGAGDDMLCQTVVVTVDIILGAGGEVHIVLNECPDGTIQLCRFLLTAGREQSVPVGIFIDGDNIAFRVGNAQLCAAEGGAGLVGHQCGQRISVIEFRQQRKRKTGFDDMAKRSSLATSPASLMRNPDFFLLASIVARSFSLAALRYCWQASGKVFISSF